MACFACRGGMGRREPASPGSKAEEGEERLRIQLRSAQLQRSFAKVGLMDPYVVVAVDGREVHRTAPSMRGHKTPSWDVSFTVRAPDAPRSVTVSVRSANRLGKDVLCGCATVPCPAGPDEVGEREVTLEKRALPTGTLRFSLSLLGAAAAAQSPAAREQTYDLVASPGSSVKAQWLAESASLASRSRQGSEAEEAGPTLLSPKRSRSGLGGRSPLAQKDINFSLDAAETPKSGASGPRVPHAVEEPGGAAAAGEEEADSFEILTGSWNCVATQGLEEFLKATGAGTFQRKFAMAARWPAWEFSVSNGRISFTNHSQMGDLKEEIVLGGGGYQHKDGRGNPLTCNARWEKTADGGVLTISRTGFATFIEERRVAGDTLTFVLTNEGGESWGRTFKRA